MNTANSTNQCHKKYYSCIVCNVEAETREEINEHLERNDVNSRCNIIIIYKCIQCILLKTNSDNLLTHYLHIGPFPNEQTLQQALALLQIS